MSRLSFRRAIGGSLCALLVLGLTAARAFAQSEGQGVAQSPGTRAAIRFTTDSDYPPFHFVDEEGILTGFNVDVAQAVCLELAAACDVQAKSWDDLLPALRRRETDAIIASHAVTPRLLSEFAVSDRYFPNVGRFAVRRPSSLTSITPEGLDGKRVGVARGTPHESYLRAFFRDSSVQTFETVELARDALVSGSVDLIFDDGTSLIFWLTGTLSRACCELAGGPYYEPRYFGDGAAIVVRKGDGELLGQINRALDRVRASGRYDELLSKYFPARIF